MTSFRKFTKGKELENQICLISDRGQGSLTLDSVFYDKENCDPRAYYSEGHLDSLGLCIFLAIRKFHHQISPELSILVLDDVLHSIDGNHRRETANLIFEKFKDHQIIITTHDPLWFEYLKKAKSSSGIKCTVKKLASWSIESGPEWGDHLSDYEWLTSEKCKSLAPSEKAGRAGRLLEEMLQNLCNNLKIAVPFDISGKYTSCTRLWGPFFSKAKGKLKTDVSMLQILADLEQLRSQRNWVGAHCNLWAQQLTTKEADDFVRNVLYLRDKMYCPKCHKFIESNHQINNLWSCACSNLQFTTV